MDDKNQQSAEQAPAQPSPWDVLAQFKDAPSPAKIESVKRESPGGRVKIFSPDGKRVFLLRGLSGIELAEIHGKVHKNATNPDYEIQLMSCEKALVWSSFGKLTSEDFRIGPAGLPESLFALVQNLSDFYDPMQLFQFSAEL